MKKTIRITVLTALLLTLSLASAGTMAGAKTKNGFTYKVTKNQVKIVSCSKNQKRIVIPNKIAGKKVTALGANVWKKSSKVQTVVLPKYLKTIEKKQADYAWGNIVKKKNIFSTPFTGCGKLKNIKVAKVFCIQKTRRRFWFIRQGELRSLIRFRERQRRLARRLLSMLNICRRFHTVKNYFIFQTGHFLRLV